MTANELIPMEIKSADWAKPRHTPLQEKLLYTAFGFGPSFGTVNAIYLQVPWLEVSQPEGLDLSAWLGLSQTLAIVAFFMLCQMDTRFRFDQGKVALWACALVLCALLLVAIGWSYTFGGVSLYLYISMATSTFVGTIGFGVVIPWISDFNPKMISAYLSGAACVTFAMVVMEFIQEPGSVRRFSPTIYFLTLVFWLFLSFAAGLWIVQHNIGRKNVHPDEVKELQQWRRSLGKQLFPSYWRKAFPYMAMKTWTAMLTWWVLNIMLPFAAVRTENAPGTGCSQGKGADVLQWCTGFGYASMLLGSGLSILAENKFYLRRLLVVQTGGVILVLLAATEVMDWTGKGMKVFLVAIVALVRGLFGWISPCIFREAAMFNPGMAEGINRFIALWLNVAAVFWLGMLFLVVEKYFQC